ncbi:MAG: hypothetical protein Q8K46_01635, partial [Deltaproteobacteria bacterium]|nr:hypothetical protein [Deltaproteobacteria bacterium]
STKRIIIPPQSRGYSSRSPLQVCSVPLHSGTLPHWAARLKASFKAFRRVDMASALVCFRSVATAVCRAAILAWEAALPR